MNKYEVSANGHSFGIYDAHIEDEARDLCAQEAGYESEFEMVNRIDQPSELIAKLIAELLAELI